MALIKCEECSRDISDKAPACPGCGAPVIPAEPAGMATAVLPPGVGYDPNDRVFIGSIPRLVSLSMRAVQDLGWKIDGVNEQAGLVNFQTSISWGSWSGVSCSLVITELSPGRLEVVGTGKQNVRGGQFIALNIGGEAQSKAQKAILRMQDLSDYRIPTALDSQEAGTAEANVKQTGAAVYSVGEFNFDTLGEALRFAKGQR